MDATLIDEHGNESSTPNSFEDSQVAAGPIIIGGTGTTSRERHLESLTTFPCNVCYKMTEATGMIKAATGATCNVASKAVWTGIRATFPSATFNAQASYQNNGGSSQSCGGSTCNALFTYPVNNTGLYALLVSGTATNGKSTATSDTGGYDVAYNDQLQPYPCIADTRHEFDLVPFPAPPPKIQHCPQNGQPQPSGCSGRGSGFRKDLITFYNHLGIVVDPSFQAHHIQELCFGGNDVAADNGVFLDGADHGKFTLWWRGVNVNGLGTDCASDE